MARRKSQTQTNLVAQCACTTHRDTEPFYPSALKLRNGVGSRLRALVTSVSSLWTTLFSRITGKKRRADVEIHLFSLDLPIEYQHRTWNLPIRWHWSWKKGLKTIWEVRFGPEWYTLKYSSRKHVFFGKRKHVLFLTMDYVDEGTDSAVHRTKARRVSRPPD